MVWGEPTVSAHSRSRQHCDSLPRGTDFEGKDARLMLPWRPWTIGDRVRVYVEKSWEVLQKDKVKLQLLWRPQYSIQASILGHSPKRAVAVKWSSLCLRVKLCVTAVGVRGLKLLKSFEVQKVRLWVQDVEQKRVFRYLAFSFFLKNFRFTLVWLFILLILLSSYFEVRIFTLPHYISEVYNFYFIGLHS